jgi:hypothetical protein
LRVAGPLQQAGGVTRRAGIVAAVAAVGVTGCFYTSPINERPSSVLHLDTPGAFRANPVTVSVETIEPDGDEYSVTWTATACNEGGTACEATPFANGTVNPLLDKFTFTVKDAPTTRSVRVVAHTEDYYHAAALQDAELVIAVGNAPPTVSFQINNVGPPGAPTYIVATAVDVDDGADLTFAPWGIEDAPFPSDGLLEKVSDNTGDPDRQTAQETYRLIPDVEGTWTIAVTVADPLGEAETDTQPILIGTDHPPCLAQVAPLPPPEGNSLPLDELRRFSVLVVDDDLDIWPPPPPDDAFFGATEFRWYLATPATGGDYVEIPGAESFVELDPAAYAPDDDLSLRVEIADRVPRTLPCPEGDLTCAIDPASTPPCIQRQTWTLEVQ